jgi:hypothetical protein
MDSGAAALAERLGLAPDSVRDVRAATLDEVMHLWSAGRDVARGSGPWTRRMLERADAQCAGRWLECAVRGDALLDVHLPRHAGEPCHGDRRDLVPDGGQTVREAARTLRTWDEAARAESRECWRRLSAALHEPLTRVVLSTAPLSGHPDYAGLPPGPALFHLDGWHRLVAWALADRLDATVWLDAHVADAWT